MDSEAHRAEMEVAGHNHCRVDGGPEFMDTEHDKWYPDCPVRES